jgi:hypothetical protein
LWLSSEHFHKPVEPAKPPLPAELEFAQHKDGLRRKSGLRPLLAPATKNKLAKDLHASYMSSALNRRVDLETLAGLADSLVENLDSGAGSFIEYTDNTAYGEHLANRALLSCNLMAPQFADSDEDINEHFRGHLALANIATMLPNGALDQESLEDQSRKAPAADALLEYYAWLRSQKFISERTLESILLQHERFDGNGIPYGLSGDELPAISETWAMCNTYSSQLYSRPKKPRISGRDAADHLISSAGKAYSSRNVNSFLNVQGYYPNGSLVELNDKRCALVVAQSAVALLKPDVRPLDAADQVGSILELHKDADLYILRQLLEY